MVPHRLAGNLAEKSGSCASIFVHRAGFPDQNSHRILVAQFVGVMLISLLGILFLPDSTENDAGIKKYEIKNRRTFMRFRTFFCLLVLVIDKFHQFAALKTSVHDEYDIPQSRCFHNLQKEAVKRYKVAQK